MIIGTYKQKQQSMKMLVGKKKKMGMTTLRLLGRPVEVQEVEVFQKKNYARQNSVQMKEKKMWLQTK